MGFDIHQLDRVPPDSEGREKAFEAFQKALVERFEESPEGQERMQADPRMGDWVASTDLLWRNYFQYEGYSVPQMTAYSVQTIVTDLFPRKISLQSPGDADETIPALIAFWRYLKREFKLPEADAILGFLREVEPDFPGMMSDPSNFGMAKGFFTMGRAAGFDMTTQDGLNAFMLAFNSGLIAQHSAPKTGQRARPSRPRASTPRLSKQTASTSGSIRVDPAAKKLSEKMRRKQQEQAKKRNRKGK